MEFVTMYGVKRKVGLDCKDKSRTKQSHKDECNINFIVDRYRKTGMVEHVRKFNGEYGDFQSVDFHEAMNAVAQANQMFDSLPSKVRSKFDNNPAKFMDFVHDPKNKEEITELGLAKAPPIKPVVGAPKAPQASVDPTPSPGSKDAAKPASGTIST